MTTPQSLEQRQAQGLTPNEVKHRLRQQGLTLKSWAEQNGYRYRTVSDVMRGHRRGNYGEGRDVAIALGLPVAD